MSRGSTWQIWDTHIHSFASFQWNGFKQLRACSPQESDRFLALQVERFNSLDIAVFALVDYWTLDGYLALQEYLIRHPGALKRTVLPGIELRVQSPTEYRLNLQVILSERLKKQHLTDFKAKLLVGTQRAILSDQALTAVGMSINPDTAAKHGFVGPLSDEQRLLLGMQTAEVTRESLWDALKYLADLVPEAATVVLPWDTYNGFDGLDFVKHPQASDDFLHRIEIVETRDAKSRDLFLLQETPANRKFIKNFSHAINGKRKLPLCGSDAHDLKCYGVFPGSKLCWVKAQPTFRGLRQACVEPAQRSYIGDEPTKLKHTKENPTKYIDKLTIKRKSGASCDEWFDVDLEFNPGLVAIIGNKGSGKSALADVLAMMGFSANETHYSFLNQERFLNLKDKLGDKFEASIQWLSGETRTAVLSTRRVQSAVSRVNYLPQKRLEEICTEIAGTLEETRFEKEVKSVIFSHVSEELRGSHSDLNQLIGAKSDATRAKIRILQTELETLNGAIYAIGEQLRPGKRHELEKQLEHKKKELEAHQKLEPQVLDRPDPSKDPDLAQRMVRLGAINDELGKLAAHENEAKRELRRSNERLIELKSFREKLENIQLQVKLLTDRLATDSSQLELNLEQIVQLRIDFQQVDEPLAVANSRVKELERTLVPETLGSIAFQKAALEAESKSLKDQLGEKDLAYQKSIEGHQTWQRRLEEIKGASDRPESILFYENALAELDRLPSTQDEQLLSRRSTLREIYECKVDLSNVYRELFRPVKSFIADHPLTKSDLPISFEVEITQTGFKDSFLSKINQARIGPLQGREEGGERVQKLLDATDWNDFDQVTKFVEEVEKLLRDDGATNSSQISVQTTKGSTPSDLLNELYGLDYLKPRYALKLRGKSLNELSPGERGTILLIFYLLIDKNDVPLIIDQPEDNLDNQTVYRLLVPCIQEARERRQVFMVTHNPNLAVVCDAEQIIVADREVSPQNRISYRAGAIEDAEINKELIDILEGTRPAFQNRDQKYFETEST